MRGSGIRSLDGLLGDARLDAFLAVHSLAVHSLAVHSLKVAPPEALGDGMGCRPCSQFVGNSLKEKLDVALRHAELLRDPGLGVPVAAPVQDFDFH
jgi:hypothetical protein